MAGKRSKRAAKAALANRAFNKKRSIREQVHEAREDGRLNESTTEVADHTKYQENRQKAHQSRKRRQTTKGDFTWATTGSIRAAKNVSRTKTSWTWCEGAMAKVSRRLWGIPKDAICMVLSAPDEDGYIQVLYDGLPFQITAASLRPMGWIEDDDE